MRLKNDGQDFAICSYTKGNGIPTDSGGTPESFKRRAYWLKENPRVIFVHYLDEANKYYLQWINLTSPIAQSINNSDFTQPFFEEVTKEVLPKQVITGNMTTHSKSTTLSLIDENMSNREVRNS